MCYKYVTKRIYEKINQTSYISTYHISRYIVFYNLNKLLIRN